MRLCKGCLKAFRRKSGQKKKPWPAHVYHAGESRNCEYHTGRNNHYSATRRSAKLNASVQWADQKAIASIYAEAAAINRAAGRRAVEVDHIVPLKGRRVCGLHVENNLQILPRHVNARKSNHF